MTRFALFSPIACCLFAVPAMADQSSMASEVKDVRMVGVQNYMMEKCVKTFAGQTVEYSFESPYPLDFNIHYHTETETFYEDKQDNVKRKSGVIRVASDQQYCFTWINMAEFGAEWTIPLRLKVIN